MSSRPNKKANRNKKKKHRKKKKQVDVRDTNRYQHWQAKASLLGAILTYVPQAKQDFDRLLVMNPAMTPIEAGDFFIRQMTLAANAYMPFREPELKPIVNNPPAPMPTSTPPVAGATALPDNQQSSAANVFSSSIGLKRPASDMGY